MRHAAPSILAIDIGTRLGWALLSENRVVSGSYDMMPAPGEGLGVRYLKFRRHFLVNFKAVREVYYEEVRRHDGTHAAHVYGGFLSHLLAFCEENAIPYKGVEVAIWKKSLGLKGNAQKSDVMEVMIGRGFTPYDENEADALAILSWARHQRGAA